MGPSKDTLITIVDLLQALTMTLLRLVGLAQLVEPDEAWPEPNSRLGSMPASLVRDLLPAMKYRDLGPGRAEGGEPERCTVCLGEFRGHEEVRRLRNCGHVFHKGCVDRWMDHDQRTCPLCRTHFIPQELVEAFDEIRKCSAADFPEFGGDFSPINFFL